MNPEFKHHVIDTGLEGGGYAQTALADLDGCGRPEYIVGRREGDLYVYKYRAPDHWTCFLLGADSPSDVGAAIVDVDGDGRLDVVTGGAWYRNSGDFSVPFERFVFDADLTGVHDVAVGDLDGDGKPEVVTMLDRSDVRWYRIGDDPTQPWLAPTRIGDPVHAGIGLGDLDGDGDLDIFSAEMEAVGGDAEPRWYLWENVDGKGTQWQEHVILDANLGGHEIVVGDVTGNGTLDILGKPWRPAEGNAVDGKMFVVFLEGLAAT